MTGGGVGMATIHSYWLVPAEPIAVQLRAQIEDLATHYDAVRFDPHMTIYAGRSNDAEVVETMRELRASFRPLTVTPFVIGQSSRLTKTLYIRLRLTEELTAISERIRAKAKEPTDYRLDDPHVSLMYKTIAEAERQRLAQATPVPAPFVVDGIVAMETASPITELDQVRAWRFVERWRYGQ